MKKYEIFFIENKMKKGVAWLNSVKANKFLVKAIIFLKFFMHDAKFMLRLHVKTHIFRFM